MNNLQGYSANDLAIIIQDDEKDIFGDWNFLDPTLKK